MGNKNIGETILLGQNFPESSLLNSACHPHPIAKYHFFNAGLRSNIEGTACGYLSS